MAVRFDVIDATNLLTAKRVKHDTYQASIVKNKITVRFMRRKRLHSIAQELYTFTASTTRAIR